VLEDPAQLAAEVALALHGRPGRNGAEDPEPERAEDAVARPTLTGRKVLIVDDDVRNLFALASLLEDRGAEVVFGETGTEALAALQRHADMDLVLMDIMMPDMDGYETIEAIRSMPDYERLPIIAVTAKAMQGDRDKSLAAGASHHITKPVDPDRLMELVGACLTP